MDAVVDVVVVGARNPEIKACLRVGMLISIFSGSGGNRYQIQLAVQQTDSGPIDAGLLIQVNKADAEYMGDVRGEMWGVQ